MLAGSKHVLYAAMIGSAIVLAVPTAAVAGGCNASACKVYHEGSAPSAGKQQPTQGPTQSPPTGGGQTTTHQSSKLSRVLAGAGADKGPLSQLLQNSDDESLQNGEDVASPGLLGAVFDLGAGPLVLLAILFGTAIGLAARGGVWQRLRRRPSA